MDTPQSAQKTCTVCGEVKPLEGFHRQPTGPMGRHSWCKPCLNSAARASRIKNATPEQKRRWNLRSKYGLAPEDVDRMMAAQNGKCAICERVLTRPHIDHCHKTGAVRGLLCLPCNIKLHAIEDETYLEAAQAYLART